MIATADAADPPELAALMAGSALLQRYRVTLDSALQSLTTAQEAGDLLLLSRHHAAITGLAWLSFAPRVLNAAAYLRLLLVAESARNTGTGSRLLEAAEVRARDHANHLYLLVTTDNTAARRDTATATSATCPAWSGRIWTKRSTTRPSAPTPTASADLPARCSGMSQGVGHVPGYRPTRTVR